MKRQWIVVPAFLLIAACGEKQNETGKSTETPPQAINADTIIGTWAYTIEATQCEEHITFNRSKSFSAISLDEILTGNYSVNSQDTDKPVFKITTRVLTDNLLADCNGDSSNDAGQGEFASFFGFSDTNTLIRYTDASADIPQRIYTRTEQQNP